METLNTLSSWFNKFVALGLTPSVDLASTTNSVLLMIAAQAVVTYLIERRYHENKKVRVTASALAALAATAYSVWLLATGESQTGGDILLAFFVFLFMWGLFFHLFAMDFGHSLLTAKVGPSWVRAIDYLYLGLSTVGILRLVSSLNNLDAGQDYLSLLSPLLLGFGIALRMTKTSVEIFAWDQAPKKPAG